MHLKSDGFVAMPPYCIRHKGYLQFVLSKIVYFHEKYPNNTDIINLLALEFLASAYQININPDQENPSPSIKKHPDGTWIIDQLDSTFLFTRSTGYTHNGKNPKQKHKYLNRSGSEQIKVTQLVENYLLNEMKVHPTEVKRIIKLLNAQFSHLTKDDVEKFIKSLNIN